jgi:hypothetical protein
MPKAAAASIRFVSAMRQLSLFFVPVDNPETSRLILAVPGEADGRFELAHC